MLSYTAPIRDLEFVLREVFDFDRAIADLPPYREMSWEMAAQVLEGAARFSTEELLPLNAIGDQQGCQLNGGEVRTPDGFRAAYQRYCGAGWQGIVAETALGGQALPHAVYRPVEEILNSSNQAWAMYSSLTHGAYAAVSALGTDAVKRIYLAHLANGRWTGTMCLTEPQCGTDLGLIRTTAQPVGSDCYRVTGTKVFVSGGDHDLSENIVHLVLARMPDAPPGTKGLSLFLVPKCLPTEAGGVGERNAVSCGGLEHKMGIHGNATCTLNFEDSQGWLLGERHRGLSAMFVMMNGARLTVAVQSLGLSEIAYQNARDYAKTRLQSRSLSGPKAPELCADPIIVHADVRRMLLTQKAYVEGGRAMISWIALMTDESKHHPEATRRTECDELVALLTPLAKSFLTDNGFLCTNLALQVFGGHGYIRDSGIEQLVRDARINSVYEGTNAVQALDLIGRKVLLDQGAKLRRLTDRVRRFIESDASSAHSTEFAVPLAALLSDVERITMDIGVRAASNRDEVGAAAVDYLRLVGHLVYGYLWARMASVASAGSADDAFYESKVATARFYFQYLLPETSALLTHLGANSQGLFAMSVDGF